LERRRQRRAAAVEALLHLVVDERLERGEIRRQPLRGAAWRGLQILRALKDVAVIAAHRLQRQRVVAHFVTLTSIRCDDRSSPSGWRRSPNRATRSQKLRRDANH